MKKIKFLCLVLTAIISLCALTSCAGKKSEPELTEAQKFAAQISVDIAKEIPLEDGKITFRVKNSADRDCYILGPLGLSMVQYRFSTNPDIYTYMANGPEYYEDDYMAGCQTYNERNYLTVAAGTTVEYTIKGEWFVGFDANAYRLTLSITDDVTDGIFETFIEKDFEVE